MLHCGCRTLFLALAAGSATATGLRELDGLGFCEGEQVLVKSNPLKGLKELQKVHHSWPIPADYLGSSDPSFAGGAGFKALMVVSGAAGAYLHSTKTKVRFLVVAVVPVDGKRVALLSRGVRCVRGTPLLFLSFFF